MKDFCVELKVCEACGALWLRAAESGVYCRGCASWLSEFPASMAEGFRVRNKDGRYGRQRPALGVPALTVCVGGSL
jgi:hypothetical protein